MRIEFASNEIETSKDLVRGLSTVLSYQDMERVIDAIDNPKSSVTDITVTRLDDGAISIEINPDAVVATVQCYGRFLPILINLCKSLYDTICAMTSDLERSLSGFFKPEKKASKKKKWNTN